MRPNLGFVDLQSSVTSNILPPKAPRAECSGGRPLWAERRYAYGGERVVCEVSDDLHGGSIIDAYLELQQLGDLGPRGLRLLLAGGLRDVVRERWPDAVFTYWDYRAGMCSARSLGAVGAVGRAVGAGSAVGVFSRRSRNA